jgi:pSer/pThr/pTyr-binding forkhead associated (FHA) protein
MKMQPSIAMMLIHIHGPMKGNIQEFSEGCVSIGRHPSCAVRFPSDNRNSISRKHAEITREGNQFKLIDHSTNGTYLNGKKVAEAYLKDGDVLEFSEGGPKVSFITKVVELQDAAPHGVITHDELEVHREEIVLDRPLQPDHFQPVRSDETPPFPSYKASQSTPSLSQQPASRSPEELPTAKINAPLVIQFGPSLRSYRELPVTIGSNPTSDFVIIHPSILGQHAQIIFAKGQYWIRDLTGQGKIRVNNGPIPFQAALHSNDLISLAACGPALSFLGEGRFAEAEESVKMAHVEADEGNSGFQEKLNAGTGAAEGLWAKLKKRF